jgi:hypothetical protein
MEGSGFLCPITELQAGNGLKVAGIISYQSKAVIQAESRCQNIRIFNKAFLNLQAAVDLRAGIQNGIVHLAYP